MIAILLLCALLFVLFSTGKPGEAAMPVETPAESPVKIVVDSLALIVVTVLAIALILVTVSAIAPLDKLP